MRGDFFALLCGQKPGPGQYHSNPSERKEGDQAMNRTKASLLTLAVLTVSPQAVPAPAGGTVSGKVTLSGTPPKGKPFDLSKEPECVKMHASDPRSEEHTSELQSRDSISYAVF